MFPLWVVLVVSWKWRSGCFYTACTITRVNISVCLHVLSGAWDAERGRDIFHRDPKLSGLKTEKNNGICLHNLETTEGWGTTYWCTTIVRILWNYKGTNSWPPQHTFRNTADWGLIARLRNAGVLTSPRLTIPPASWLLVFLTNVSIPVAADVKYYAHVHSWRNAAWL